MAGRDSFRGQRIEFRDGRYGAEAESRRVLLIDDEEVPFGQLPDGQYALVPYAYDAHESLADLARTFVNYRRRAAELREEPRN